VENNDEYKEAPLLDLRIQSRRVSKLFKIISDPTRIAILYLLENQEFECSTIAKS